MKPRKFHLWDFPDDKIRIMMRGEIMDEFFDSCLKNFRSMQAYSKFLSLPEGRVQSWKSQKLFIPLWAIRKTIPEISWSWKFVEENTVAYKSVRRSKPITNPVLPINECPEIFELVAHLMCDGTVSDGTPAYINSRMELIENLKELLETIFGNVNGSLDEHQSFGKAYQYTFSKIVYELIYHFYKPKFGSFDAELPKEVFELPKRFACSFIKAVVDDEGTVRENRITIVMKNKKFMTQFRKLLMGVLSGEHVSSLTVREKDYWIVSVRASGMKKFKNKVNLSHPGKIYDLEIAVNKDRLIGCGEPVWDTKIRILELLKNESLVTKTLYQKLSINTGNILSHLREMKRKNFVSGVKNKYTIRWTITQQGLNFLSKWNIDKKPLNIKLPEWDKKFHLCGKGVRILLNQYGRKRLFWMMERVLKNQTKIGEQFNVHRNSVTDWKRGLNSLKLSTLNDMLMFLGNHGIDITKEIENSIQEVRYLNGRYKIGRL